MIRPRLVARSPAVWTDEMPPPRSQSQTITAAFTPTIAQSDEASATRRARLRRRTGSGAVCSGRRASSVTTSNLTSAT